MTDTEPRGITHHIRTEIPSPPLRVAAYCRTASDSPEQRTFIEEQRDYYTRKIADNPQWTMAGIFVDAGASGNPSAKRPEFRRMLRQCRQKKIDLILVRSASRFGRCLEECLNTVETLRELGVAVIFEKENISTMDPNCDVLVSLMADIFRAECEHFTRNSAHTHYMKSVGRPTKKTWTKTIRLPGHPEKTITFRME